MKRAEELAHLKSFGDMWRYNESEAIEIGLDLNYYWTLTPKQFTKHVESYANIANARLKEADTLNHLLGQYIRSAFNEPNKYPEQPYLSKEVKIMTDDEMERRALHNTILLGGNTKT